MNVTNVKQERHDEAEEVSAVKLTAATKHRMVGNQQKANNTGVGQNLRLTSMMNSKKKQNDKIQSTSSETRAVDEDSIRGRFGWETISKNLVPYIIRAGEKYCATRMVEMKALNKYLSNLQQDIYDCACITTYYITEHECRLLNEINVKHCGNQFGKKRFSKRDQIVRVSDAIEFYNFLRSCYMKLVNEETDSVGRSGFIRIDKESVVPYTIYNDQKYVPLFYFEGDTENVKPCTKKLEGWDLSYLKFCCKVQGIRNELFLHDSCTIVSLNDIKDYFPPGTLFEDYWPKDSVDSHLLISGNTRNQTQIIRWTRQPVAPPVTHSVPPIPKTVGLIQPNSVPSQSQMHNVHHYPYNMAQHSYHPPQSWTPGSAIRNTYPAAVDMHLRLPYYYTNLTQGPPPPLVPTTQTDHRSCNSHSFLSQQ